MKGFPLANGATQHFKDPDVLVSEDIVKYDNVISQYIERTIPSIVV
jgi:hypothetical protein